MSPTEPAEVAQVALFLAFHLTGNSKIQGIVQNEYALTDALGDNSTCQATTGKSALSSRVVVSRISSEEGKDSLVSYSGVDGRFTLLVGGQDLLVRLV